MSVEKRFSVGRGLQGCLIASVFHALIVMVVLLVSILIFGLLEAETEIAIEVFGWFAAIAVGGYWAAMRGKTTGWTNAFVVGFFAECYAAYRMFKGTSPALVDYSGLHWRLLVMLGFTVPAALLGGCIWVWQRKRRERVSSAAGKKGPPPCEHVV